MLCKAFKSLPTDFCMEHCFPCSAQNLLGLWFRKGTQQGEHLEEMSAFVGSQDDLGSTGMIWGSTGMI